MQIDDFVFSNPVLIPKGNNLWELASDVVVAVHKPAGRGWRFKLLKGFITNLRSGSDLINPVIPRMGNEAKTISYILHDALYTWHDFGGYRDHWLSKQNADDLLKAMLRKCNEYIKAEIAACELAGNGKQIKLLKGELLSGFKIWAIHKAVSLFGGKAYTEPNEPPYDRNDSKVAMEVF
jgi:hypothetical protein